MQGSKVVVGRSVSLFALIGLATLAAACSPTAKTPDLAEIYSGVAQAGGGELRRPLITVPGTLGSRLVDHETGTIVWGGGSRGLSADPDDPVEARLIALPFLANGEAFAEQRDGVRAAGVLDTARADVLGLSVDLEVYGGIRRNLGFGGFRVEPGATPDDEAFLNDVTAEPPILEDPEALDSEDPATAFRFDYDWRKDLVTLAQDFHRFVMERKEAVAEQRTEMTGNKVHPADVTFDLLAHSMGGLITRYYLMHGPADLKPDGHLPPITWEGADHFNRVIIVATPNAGSILAMDNLINGKELGPFQPVYPASLLATHASTWQLMPRQRHNRVHYLGTHDEGPDIYAPETWEEYGWGLAGPSAEPLLSWLMPQQPDPVKRREIALRHQARMLRRAERFHEAMDRWARKPRHLDMFLVVGGGFETPSSALVDPATGRFQLDAVEEGDGVVLRTSVLLDERQGGDYAAGLQSPLRFDTVLFLPDEHVELTKNPVFGDNLLFWLLEQPRDAGALRAPRESIKSAVVPDLTAELSTPEDPALAGVDR